VFSQLAVGLSVLALFLPALTTVQPLSAVLAAQTCAVFGAALFALTASIMHLGRPLGAWRSFLGLRRSWLSREIVALGGFIILAALATGSLGLGLWTEDWARRSIGLATAMSGGLAVFYSAMIYHDTRRDFWRLAWTAGKFFGTTLLLGAAGTM